MPQDEFATVFWSKDYSGNAEAEILKSLLDSAGIQSMIRWIPHTFTNDGGLRLLVLREDLAEAEEVIREAQTPEAD